MLYTRNSAYPLDEDKVVEERLPGEAIFEHLKRGTATRRMMVAAAKEFRRAHSFWSDDLAGHWSHGDATSGNVIYDPATNRAQLIDFETMHEKSLAAPHRHADDLFVFLLDVVALAPRRRWLMLAQAFINSDGDAKGTEELRLRCRLPRGFTRRVWWAVRTNFVKSEKVMRRLNQLRCALASAPEMVGEPVGRRRQSRRPSTHCQAINPGTPNDSSRSRRIIASASEVSAGIPSNPPTTTYPPS
jgi:hypothetical protein